MDRAAETFGQDLSLWGRRERCNTGVERERVSFRSAAEPQGQKYM